MIKKVIAIVLVFLLVGISFNFLLDYLDEGDPIDLKKNYVEPERTNFIGNGSVPVFADKLRFKDSLISYDIDEGCDSERKKRMIAAFEIFASEVGVVSFFEDGMNSDIKVGCSNDFIGLGENLFAAGEGGPSRIVNGSGFKVIEEGKIILYNSEDCGYPIVELHELCHVFGFDHSEDPDNIMYNTSTCDQRMSDDMVELIQDIYSAPALADLKIGDSDGVIHGKYLDFNISVLNEGLNDAINVSLGIFADGEKVDSVGLGDIEIGYGRTLMVENMIVGNGVREVRFVVDEDGLVRELDEGNNAVELTA